MKVPVEFEIDIKRDAVIPINIGRFMIGNHIARLYFTQHGKTLLVVPKTAVKDGSLILVDDHAEYKYLALNTGDKNDSTATDNKV